jgi:hypothetical protein
MRISRPALSALLLAGLLAPLALPLQAGPGDWQDPFASWAAYGYAQGLLLARPQDGQAPAGRLDSQGDNATGWYQDGLVLRHLELALSGPLGWQGWSATAAVFTDLNAVGFTDLFVQWQPAGLRLRAGQLRLPFGDEEQASAKDIVAIQRSLFWGFSNYGTLGPWGLSCLAERGWGLRLDQALSLGGVALSLQAGGFDAGGGDFNPGICGVARAQASWQQGSLSAQAGASGSLGRSTFSVSDLSYAPLGAQRPSASPWVATGGLAGHGLVETGGADARLGLGPLCGQAEGLLQTLAGHERGGLAFTAWLDLPSWEAASLRPYARLEQAWTSFADGVHQPDSLYRLATLGLRLPLPWALELKLEGLQFMDDDFADFGGGRIYQAQLQAVF